MRLARETRDGWAAVAVNASVPPSGTSPKSTRAYLGFWLRLAFGIAVLSSALALADVGRVAETLRALRPGPFVLAFALSVASTILVPAIITGHTLRAGNIRLTLRELVQINLIMRFYVLVLPHALTVGMRWFRYRGERSGHGWQAAALIVFERVVQFTVVVVFAFAFLLAARAGLPAGLHVLIPISAALCALGVLLFLTFVSARAFIGVRPLIFALARRGPRFVATRVDRFVEAVSAYQHLGNRRVGFVVLWSVAAYLLFVSSAYVMARTMNLPVGFVDIGWMRSAVLLMTVLPITVGGIGVREAGFAGLLYLHGADRSVALAFPLALLAIQLLIGLAGAAIEVANILRKTGGPADAAP